MKKQNTISLIILVLLISGCDDIAMAWGKHKTSILMPGHSHRRTYHSAHTHYHSNIKPPSAWSGYGPTAWKGF